MNRNETGCDEDVTMCIPYDEGLPLAIVLQTHAEDVDAVACSTPGSLD